MPGSSRHSERSRSRTFSKPGGGGSSSSALGSKGGSSTQRCSSSIQPGVRATCHARKRIISGGRLRVLPTGIAANLPIDNEASDSIFARWASIVSSGPVRPPGPSYKPRAIEMFLGERRLISPVLTEPSHTNGSRPLSDSGARNPLR